MAGQVNPVTQMSGFTTQIDTWDGVKVIADFTWPASINQYATLTTNEVDLNGSFFVTPAKIVTDDKLVYGGANITQREMLISGDIVYDQFNLPVQGFNGYAVSADEIALLKADSEGKMLRFVTSMTGTVKLECPRIIDQVSDAGEVESYG